MGGYLTSAPEPGHTQQMCVILPLAHHFLLFEPDLRHGRSAGGNQRCQVCGALRREQSAWPRKRHPCGYGCRLPCWPSAPSPMWRQSISSNTSSGFS